MDENLLNGLVAGSGLGLLMTLYVAVKSWSARRILRAEIARLKDHLHSHMEISHEGTSARKEELDKLRKENENLRITVKTWQLKPDRKELRTLHLYDHAARDLMKNAPGFASHWEAALDRAEEVIAQEDKGLLAFARRLVLPRRRDTHSASEPEERDG